MTNLIYDTESQELPAAEIIEKMVEAASMFVVGASGDAGVTGERACDRGTYNLTGVTGGRLCPLGYVICHTVAEVCLTFLSPDEMRELNREHRSVDSVTDVLSFPQYVSEDLPYFYIGDAGKSGESGASVPGGRECVRGTYNLTHDVCQIIRPPDTPRPPGTPADEPSLLLGDIVICTERAREQATEYGHSEEREFLYLFVHGMLHLLGYDHETEADKSAMREKEESIMKMIGCTVE